jgi:hypothetical protein
MKLSSGLDRSKPRRNLSGSLNIARLVDVAYLPLSQDDKLAVIHTERILAKVQDVTTENDRVPCIRDKY